MNWTLPSNECCVRNAKYVWEPQRYCRNDSPKLLLFIDVGMTDLPTTHERGKQIGVFFHDLFVYFISLNRCVLYTATNRDLVTSSHFPALQAICLGLLWVLIGCLSYLPLIWLALVITMVLIYNTWLKCALRFSGCFLLFFYLKEIIIIWVLNMNCFSYKFSECPKSWSQRQVGDKCNVTFWFSFSSFYSYFPLTI